MAALDEILEEPALQPDWRAPTEGEHVCVHCGASAGYGLGNTWFCRRCAPADFLPANRGASR